MRVGTGGKAAVAAGSALLAVALAAAPLYVSSATSEALQVSLAHGCPSDAGIVLNVDDTALAALEARARTIDHVEPPVRTVFASVTYAGPDAARGTGELLWRDGATTGDSGSLPTPSEGDVAVPARLAASSGLGAGDELRLTPDGGSTPVEVSVSGEYADIPVRPEPAAWCSLGALLRPDSDGDPAAPVFLADEATVRSVALDDVSMLWELRPDPTHLTEHSAEQLLDDYDGLVAAAAAGSRPSGAGTPLVADQTEPGLARLLDSAKQVGTTVSRGVLAIRLVGAAVALALLALAGVLISRERRSELQLRLIRGERPRGIAVRIAESHIVPALVGTAVGTAVAVIGVRALGPTPELESAALRNAIVTAVVGLLAGVAVVSGVGAAATDATVDRRSRPRRFVPPWEAIVVALAIASATRIDHGPGLRLAGSAAGSGDVLAQAFPLLAVAAAAAVLVRPLRWLFGRARRSGRRLGPAALLGWRRIGTEPGASAWVAAAVALGVGTALVAGSMAATSDRLLIDKAGTFLGADLRVVTEGDATVPAGLVGSVVSRVDAKSGTVDVQVLGIDPTTVASAVRWRDDASDYPLVELLRVLEVDDMKGAALPAVVIGGPLTDLSLTGADGLALDVNPVAAAEFFPGKTAVPLVVVNRNALAADEVSTSTEIWLRDPPADATELLAEAGIRVGGSQAAADVFDVGSSLAVRWSYTALWAFAAGMGVVVVVVELMIVGARRRSRRAAWATDRRMGQPPPEFAATVLAFGLPSLIGALFGAAVGWAVVRLSVDHLDHLENLPPPVRTIFDIAPLGVAVGVAAVAVLVAAVAARIGAAGTDEMEVMRDGSAV